MSQAIRGTGRLLQSVAGPTGFSLIEHGSGFVQRTKTFAPIADYRFDTRSSTAGSFLQPVHSSLLRHDHAYFEDVQTNLTPLNNALGKVNTAIQKGWIPDRPTQVEDFISARTPLVTDRSNYQAPRGEAIVTADKKAERGLSDIPAQRILQVKTGGQSAERIAETLKHENSHLRDDTVGFDLSKPLHAYASEVNAFNRASSTWLSPVQPIKGTLFGDVKAEYQSKLNVSGSDATRLETIGQLGRIEPHHL